MKMFSSPSTQIFCTKGSVFLVKLAKQIVVRGRVQGVGFRWATKMIADNLNIQRHHRKSR